MTTLAYPTDWTAEREAAFQEACRGERWVHTTDPHSFGQIIGWRDDRSPTGWLSGFIEEVRSMSVRVSNIMAASHQEAEADGR